jgi:hypothetical protein
MMIMTLEDIAHIGELLGGIGVLGSLIFVGLQVRQNTQSVRSSTLQLNADYWLNYFSMIADPKFSTIYAKGSLGQVDLDQGQFGQFFVLCRATFMGMENQHYQFLHGLLDSDAYAGYETTIREQVAAFPGIRAMWQLVRHTYSADFVGFMDKQIAIIPSHSRESVFRKWKALVENQKGKTKTPDKI